MIISSTSVAFPPGHANNRPDRAKNRPFSRIKPTPPSPHHQRDRPTARPAHRSHHQHRAYAIRRRSPTPIPDPCRRTQRIIYQPLVQQLQSNRTIYGIESAFLHGQRPDLNTIELVAQEYLQQIRALQPQGPYHFAGSSFGGIVAYEMAQQLQKQAIALPP